MDKNSNIYIAGHKGLVGSAILRKLQREYKNTIIRTHDELDLTKQEEVNKFFEKTKPEYVFLAAAKVGGIFANSKHPAEYIYQNTMIAFNVINAGYKNRVKKLLNLGSSCIYPKFAEQPIKEEYLLTGKLEPTNEAYAIAKINALKLCKFYNEQYGTNFISLMPTNLYGENDNFNLESSHVLPALIRKFHEAKKNNQPKVILWGTGNPKREFLYVDDLANIAVKLMKDMDYNEIGEIINVGTGKDVSIKELAKIIKKIIKYKGNIEWDTTKPDGTPRKVLDISRLHSLGLKHEVELEEGIKKTYSWFLKNKESIKKQDE